VYTYSFDVTSGSHYPITTRGTTHKSSWEAAARDAMMKHRDNLRDKKKLRKHGEEVKILLRKVKNLD